MKIGDYVRTIYGIAKIIKIRNVIGYDFKIEEACDVEAYILDKDIKPYDDYDVSNRCFIEDIIKSSPDIIDLIEVGDYVNGRKVYQVGYNFRDELVLKMSINEDGTANNYEDFIYEKDIKSIVTHEQFSQMEYKVGD